MTKEIQKSTIFIDQCLTTKDLNSSIVLYTQRRVDNKEDKNKYDFNKSNGKK
jgi:hypothetical protein